MKLRENFSNKSLLVALVMLLCLILAPLSPSLAVEHSGNITSDETWLASDNPHEITANVTVNNLVTLTLEPGVEVYFNGNYSIIVNGALSAEGTEDNLIIFTRGAGISNWASLSFYAGAGGTFDHCIIEWAGSYGISAINCSLSVSNCTIRHNNYGIYTDTINPNLTNNIIENNATGLRISNYSSPTVGANNVFKDNDTGLYFNDCMNPTVAETAVIEDNATYGVRFQACSHPTVLADITNSGTGIYYLNCINLSPISGISLTDNSGAYGAILAENSGPVTVGAGNIIAGNSYPLSIDARSYATTGSLIPVAGNVTDGIQVAGGTSQEDTTWYDFGLPYIVTAAPTLGADGSLTVESGVAVRLDANVGISVYGDLQTNGTIGNGITFTRNEAPRWNYLIFYSGSTGMFAYTDIEFAGSGIYVYSNSGPEVDSCTLHNNTQGYYGYNSATSSIHDSFINNNDYGVRLRSGSDPLISGNCIEQNRLWGVYNDDSNVTVDAEDNFWGDASGPRHSTNPAGRGDFVSDYVDFDPWLASCPL